MALLTPNELEVLRTRLSYGELAWDRAAPLFEHIEQITRDLEAARAERDLAIAHDRQPYPTAEAYEAVCAALDKHKRDLAEAKAELHYCAEAIGTVLGELKRENERLMSLVKLDAPAATSDS